MMSAPISRTRAVVEHFLAIAAVSFLLAGANAAGMFLADRLFGVGLNAGRVAGANLSAALFAMVMGSAALAAGSWLGRRGRSLAVAALFWLISDLLHFLVQDFAHAWKGVERQVDFRVLPVSGQSDHHERAQT